MIWPRGDIAHESSDLATFDYVVIGAGTAGCLMANRLSADKKNRVLLIEAGGPDDYHWIHIPMGYLYCIGNPRTDWLYQTEKEPGLNGRQIRYPRGRTLGGCSSINGMIYMRGQARDYDHWAAITGDDAWRWENVLPAFKQHEDHWLGDAPNAEIRDASFAKFHGHGGEWRIEKQSVRWKILDAFAEAAQQAGIPTTHDFNRGDNEGVGYFQVNQKSGWRWNAAKAFLRPACSSRPNFQLWSNAQVERLMIERDSLGGKRCAGAEVQLKAGRIAVKASKEVILCAGAIGSPQLLQLSGVGPGEVLRAAGVQVVHELPGVGANLQDHLQIRTVFKVQGASTLNVRASSLLGKVSIGLEYLLRRSGPMSMAPSQLGAFTRSDPSQTHPNIQYHVQPLSLAAFGDPLDTFSAITASVCNLNPSSRGNVSIRSNKPSDAPAIAPNYLSTEGDRQVAADSLRVTRNIVSQPALSKYCPQEHKPGCQYQTDQELVRLAGDIANTIFHPVGTAAMGRQTDPMAVVDSRLRVLGVANLRVVDASVMPRIVSGNTNSPTLMIAEKAAAWVLAGS